ncbi:unnamed protein product [Brassica oleracea]
MNLMWRSKDLGYVLMKYPELLGFKLEGIMSTSIAYLVRIGVSPRDIGPVVTQYPHLLGMRVGTMIKPLVDYLISIGIVARIGRETCLYRRSRLSLETRDDRNGHGSDPTFSSVSINIEPPIEPSSIFFIFLLTFLDLNAKSRIFFFFFLSRSIEKATTSNPNPRFSLFLLYSPSKSMFQPTVFIFFLIL